MKHRISQIAITTLLAAALASPALSERMELYCVSDNTDFPFDLVVHPEKSLVFRPYATEEQPAEHIEISEGFVSWVISYPVGRGLTVLNLETLEMHHTRYLYDLNTVRTYLWECVENS
ncbi:hypothetical protein FZCC0069_09050 [Rhodobacterales bacterium FZCC0069]|nr:hypothetical protein [Rhodobacterales bacterium FZCC0069]